MSAGTPEKTLSRTPDHSRRTERTEAVPERTGRLHRIIAGARTFLRSLFDEGPKPRPRKRSLYGSEVLEDRLLMSGVAAEIRIVDAEGNYVQTPPATQTETVQEQATVDFSQLPHGLFPEQWSTTIEGLGRVTIWMEGGVKVDASGIQPKNQPSGGTGWWMRFDDGPVTLVSADTQSAGSTNGMFRVVQNGDYLREGGAVKNFSLHDPTFGGIAAERLDEAQNGSPIALKSVTVQRTVTKEIAQPAVEPQTPNESPESSILDLAGLQATRAHAEALKDGSGTTLQLMVRSGADRTFVEIEDRTGQTNQVDHQPFTRMTLEHAGGTAGTGLTYRFERRTNVSAGLFTVRLYADEARTILLHEIGGMYSPDTNWMGLNPQAPASSIGDRASVDMNAVGGQADIRAWQRRYAGTPSLTADVGSNGVRSTGSALTLDLSGAEQRVTRVAFRLDADTPVMVYAYRGDQRTASETVPAGAQDIVIEDADGITAVVIGGQGLLSQVSVSGEQGLEPPSADALGFAGNADLARLAAPLPETTYLPNDFWATPLPYNPQSYNAYTIRNYSDGVGFQAIGYQNRLGNWEALPQEMYTVIGNTVVVFPNGGGTQYFGLSVRGGNGYRSDLPVGVVYDYDIRHVAAGTLQEALPSGAQRIDISSVDLFDQNTSMAMGWGSGMRLQYSGESPVAMGTLKARATVENPTSEPISFTVTTYSGYPGTDGWDTPVEVTAHTLPASGIRTLAQEVPMRADAQGRGYVRYVVTLADGTIIGEGGRSVGAPRSGERRVAEQRADGTWVLRNVGADYTGPDVTYGYDPQFVLWKQEKITQGEAWVGSSDLYNQVLAIYEAQIGKRELHASGATGTWDAPVEGVWAVGMDWNEIGSDLSGALNETFADIFYEDFEAFHATLSMIANELQSIANTAWDEAFDPEATTLEYIALEAKAHAAMAASVAVQVIKAMTPESLPETVLTAAAGELMVAYNVVGKGMSSLVKILSWAEGKLGTSLLSGTKNAVTTLERKITTNIDTIQIGSSAPVRNALSIYEIGVLENDIGHFLAEHVGKSREYLEARILDEGIDATASTFFDAVTARNYAWKAIKENLESIGSLKNGIVNKIELDVAAPSNIGMTLRQTENGIVEDVVNSARFVFRKDDNGMIYLLTAFPQSL